MKKLLVLVMVLAMASMAAATTSISVEMGWDGVSGSTITASAGATITINFIDNDPIAADAELVGYAGFSNFQVTVSSGAYVSAEFELSGPYSEPPFEFDPWHATFQPVASSVVSGDGFVVTLNGLYASPPSGPPTPTEGVMASVTLTVVGNGTVTVTGGNFDAVTDLGTLNIIPEPITVALLALGGLFIRRRK